MLILLNILIINQYCYVKMALIFEGIYVSKNVTSLQIKVHECYIKPLKARESLLTIKESDEERSDQSEGESKRVMKVTPRKGVRMIILKI